VLEGLLVEQRVGVAGPQEPHVAAGEGHDLLDDVVHALGSVAFGGLGPVKTRLGQPLPVSLPAMPSGNGAFSVGRQEEDERVVFVPRGELDLATAPEFEAALVAALDAGQHVVVDLRQLQFMDSSGVRVLIAAHARAGADGERLTLIRPAPGGTVERILEIAGVQEALRMVDEP